MNTNTTLQSCLRLAAGLWLVAGLGAASARADFTEEMRQTYPLAADGRISLANVNGSIHIRAGDAAEVRLEAVKHARKQKDLATIQIEITSQPDHLDIRTRPRENGSHWSWFGRRSDTGSVDYTLVVPRTARLDEISNVNGGVEIEGQRAAVKVSTVNGGLTARDLGGDAHLSSVNGHVEADFATVAAAKSISASTVNGAVDLGLPAGANADVSANTVNGSIRGDVPVNKHWPLGADVNARLGQGGTRVNASTVNGGVRIHLLKAEKGAN